MSLADIGCGTVTYNGKEVPLWKAKVNLEAVQTELDNAKTKIGEYETEIGNLKESLGDAEALQKKIDDLQADIDARKQADEAAAAENDLKNRFAGVCGEVQFLNDFTRDGLFNEFKTALADETNKGKSNKEIYEAITKDKENIFMPEGNISSLQDISKISTEIYIDEKTTCLNKSFFLEVPNSLDANFFIK